MDTRFVLREDGSVDIIEGDVKSAVLGGELDLVECFTAESDSGTVGFYVVHDISGLSDSDISNIRTHEDAMKLPVKFYIQFENIISLQNMMGQLFNLQEVWLEEIPDD